MEYKNALNSIILPFLARWLQFMTNLNCGSCHVSFVCCQINIKIPAAPKPSSLVQSWLSKIKTLQRLSHGSKRTIMALDGLECHQSVWTENPESSGQTRPPPLPMQLIQTHWSGFVSDPAATLNTPWYCFLTVPHQSLSHCVCVCLCKCCELIVTCAKEAGRCVFIN